MPQMALRPQKLQHIPVTGKPLLVGQAFLQIRLLFLRQSPHTYLFYEGLFQHDVGMHSLLNPFRVNHGDHGAPLGINHDVSFLCQTGQGVPHQGAAYAHLGCQGILTEHLSRRGGQAQYLIAQEIIDVTPGIYVLNLVFNLRQIPIPFLPRPPPKACLVQTCMGDSRIAYKLIPVLHTSLTQNCISVVKNTVQIHMYNFKDIYKISYLFCECNHFFNILHMFFVNFLFSSCFFHK